MRCLLSVVITLLCVGLVTSTSPPILPSPPIYEELPSVYLFTCDDRPDGTYPDQHDCTKFYECRNEKTSRRSCPDGLHFDIGNHPYGCEEPEYATCARCPESSHWTSCNGNCRPTCDDPNPVCPKVCRPGCKCNQGYVWYGEKCIAEHACRYKPSGGQGGCPENSHWDTCTAHCVGTCEDPRPPCTRMCTAPACACNEGYVWHNDKCIPESQCPKQPGRKSVPECKYGAYYDPVTGQCVCDQACDRKLHRVCGSDGQVYNNPCLLEVAACVNQQDIRIIGEPPCPSSGQV